MGKSWISLRQTSKKGKITERQRKEQTQECDIETYIFEQFSPVLHVKCHKMSCQSRLSCCITVKLYFFIVIVIVTICKFVFFEVGHK